MVGASERRHSRRYPIELPLLHTPKTPPADGSKVGWAHTLSEGGACIGVAERLQSQMPLRVRLRTDRDTLEVDAAAVWAREPPLPDGGIPPGLYPDCHRPVPGPLWGCSSLSRLTFLCQNRAR